MLNRTRSPIFALALLTIAGHAQKPAPNDDAPRAARVDAIFKEYDTSKSPGCAVAVYRDDRIVFKRAYGMANLDHDVRLTPGSVFHVASVSKQFTAAAILLLAQDGKLSLDDDVRKHVPELGNLGQKITIRQLAHHTSGIRDQWDLLGFAGWRYSRDLITDDDVLQLLARQRDLNFPPGERHLYSNSGYTLLAIIVSRVSKQSFREFTSERIFAPLGMTNTHFRDNFSEIVKNQAYGYAPAGSTFRLSVTNFDTAGATSLLTTVEDLVRWHANFDKHTVGGERFQTQLLERGALNDGQRIDYAFGVAHGTYRGQPTVSHGGADAGYRSAFMRFPEQRVGVACLCNVSTANPTVLSRRVADLFLPDTLPAEATPAPDETREVSVPEQQLRGYQGLYWNQAEASARQFVLENGRLHAVVGADRVPLKSLGEGAFVMTAGARSRFTFDAGTDGTRRVRLGSDATNVFTYAEAFAPTREQLSEYAGTYRSDEMDAVFRIVAAEASLRLERIKQRPALLDPIVMDAFRTQVGVIQFVRSPAGRISGFLLEGGRVRHLRFWKDISGSGPS